MRIVLRPAVALCLLTFAATAEAQQKFTTQVLVLPVFRGPDRGMGGKVRDIIRGRISDAFPKSEVRLVAGEVDNWLRLSGFEENAALSEAELKEMTKKFRADERILGVVERVDGRIRVNAELTLVRDLHLTQPLKGEGATVAEAAEAVAREAVAARKQLVPMRQCENLSRDEKAAEAAVAASAGVAIYPRAVPARLCLLGALIKLDAKHDTVIAVAKAVLDIAPTNATALTILADAYDSQGNGALAAPLWVRLLATDTASDLMLERVVNALAREGNQEMAQPLIDHGTEQHPENLPLLKLRWLIHLATSDWKGAVEAGEQLMTRDAASQIDPDFYARLANALKADSQPARALAIAATGVGKFPKEMPLYVTYLQLLRSENEIALTRGLATFPENAELHVLAAQNLKSAGNPAAALEETKRALAANPKLPHGYLQIAQLEIDLGQIDSAYAALEEAIKVGENPSMVAQFALARGNAFYKAANGTQKREDFQHAIKFLALATRLGPTAESMFLLGASSLSVGLSASTEAPTTKSCDLSKLADSSLVDAEINLMNGGSVAPDAAKQYLDYVAKLRPFVSGQVKRYCSGVVPHDQIAAQPQILRRRSDQNAERSRLDHRMHVGVEHAQLRGADSEFDFPLFTRLEMHALETAELDHGPRDAANQVANV